MFDKKDHWQSVYQKKSALDVSWYQRQATLSLELIHRTQITSDESIIDVGGGNSVLVDQLCQEGFTKLAVLDISGNALLSTKKRLGELAKNITWFEEDITQFYATHAYSLWHDRAVFHFLTEKSDKDSYVTALKRALRPGGHLIIAAFAIGGPEKCSGLDVVQYDSEKLTTVLGADFKLLEERNEIHTTPANKKQKFNYFRFIKIL
ncbi:hypothetical protein MNBD_GAMMA22-2929 [hydrothermal vent metagenome]|uniref:Methyltransferase type 12 domain-containing protein n=1 Tax=hydrothermal vent metagenome TaxID=652676 RepID=A0A3B1AK62_9ZZZZ